MKAVSVSAPPLRLHDADDPPTERAKASLDCLHCRKRPAVRSKGKPSRRHLCWVCCKRPELRLLYPSTRTHGNRFKWSADAEKHFPLPRQATGIPPGPEKVPVLAERYLRGEQFFDKVLDMPQDRDPDARTPFYLPSDPHDDEDLETDDFPTLEEWRRGRHPGDPPYLPLLRLPNGEGVLFGVALPRRRRRSPTLP